MSNANITINQYQELLKRITGLEQKVESKNIFVDELKKDYPHTKKTVAITDTRFNSLEEKMDYRFDVVDEKFNTQNEKFTGRFNTQDEKINSLRTEHRITSGLVLTILMGVAIKIFTSSII